MNHAAWWGRFRPSSSTLKIKPRRRTSICSVKAQSTLSKNDPTQDIPEYFLQQNRSVLYASGTKPPSFNTQPM